MQERNVKLRTRLEPSLLAACMHRFCKCALRHDVKRNRFHVLNHVSLSRSVTTKRQIQSRRKLLTSCPFWRGAHRKPVNLATASSCVFELQLLRKHNNVNVKRQRRLGQDKRARIDTFHVLDNTDESGYRESFPRLTLCCFSKWKVISNAR